MSRKLSPLIFSKTISISWGYSLNYFLTVGTYRQKYGLCTSVPTYNVLIFRIFMPLLVSLDVDPNNNGPNINRLPLILLQFDNSATNFDDFFRV